MHALCLHFPTYFRLVLALLNLMFHARLVFQIGRLASQICQPCKRREMREIAIGIIAPMIFPPTELVSPVVDWNCRRHWI